MRRLLLISVLCSTVGSAQILLPIATGNNAVAANGTFIQKKSGNCYSATNCAASFNSLPAVGNLVVVGCGKSDYYTAGTLAAPTDNQSHTYTQFRLVQASSFGYPGSGLWATVVSTSSGTFTVTCSTGADSSQIKVIIAEYKWSGGSITLDAGNSAHDDNVYTGTTINCGNATTTNTADLLLAYFTGENSVVPTTQNFSAGSGFTLRENVDDTLTSAGLQDQKVSSTGSYTPTFSRAATNGATFTCVWEGVQVP